MRTIKCGGILLLLCFAAFFNVRSQVTSLEEILKSARSFNRRDFEVEGEVIGEALNAQGGFWINIFSNGYNIPVFIPDQKWTKDIEHWGSYREQGDSVKVKGTFYENCSVHQETDIHADAIAITARGFVKKEEVASYKIKFSLYLLIICLTLAVIYFIKGYNNGRKA